MLMPPLIVTLRERYGLRKAIGQQCTVRQTGQKIVLGHMGHLLCGQLGGLGHRLGVNRSDDETLIRFPQLRLDVRDEHGFDIGGLFALVGSFLAKIRGFLTKVGGFLAQVGGFLAQVGFLLTLVGFLFTKVGFRFSTRFALLIGSDHGPAPGGSLHCPVRRWRAFACLKRSPGRSFPILASFLAHHGVPSVDHPGN
jgi:hypothetical protein